MEDKADDQNNKVKELWMSPPRRAGGEHPGEHSSTFVCPERRGNPAQDLGIVTGTGG